MSRTAFTPAAELPRLDWPFLIAAVLGTAVLITLVWLDGQPASAALIIGGFALGVAALSRRRRGRRIDRRIAADRSRRDRHRAGRRAGAGLWWRDRADRSVAD